MIKLVKDEEPFVIQSLQDAIDVARKGNIRSLAMVYMQDDKVFTDYVKCDGTTITEMIGCVEIMRTELVEAMRK